ncbi:hypothetical protein C9J03_12955 [Photobacterium gaetbulicola]|uniref:Uncharacterized protein n=1 Tax=Photobacterium gaetbulicola Gung47 TaxID=658445 RepID=A0A0C5WPR4_9GAMM|nr:hypothetical protein [Photobacterium gaetbulicola]AJR08312.1 hypothetical protein H744_2c1639 [Photobacterium gaetbulicola Gung47]PSU09013.1 hypothetical protein C9J03_12955 [Photobacterium gaetbulicola]
MNRIFRLAIVVGVFAFAPLKGIASTVDVELNYYTKANYLVSAGRYQQASEQWHRLTILFLSSEAKLGRKRMWQYAGLSEALAAISADKANDAMAYQYWADSTRYLMTGGTNWKQMKKKLHRRYEHANTLLSTQLQVADLASSIDSEWENELAVLQSWDEKLSLFSFESPKLGLADGQDRGAAIQPVTATPKVIPAYQPPQGGKKLSGLNTSYSKGQHVIPSGAPVEPVQGGSSANTQPVQTSESAGKEVQLPSVIETDFEPDEAKPVPISTETSVSRHLVVSDAEVKLQTAPVMSKGIVISGPQKSVRASDPEVKLNTGKEVKKVISPADTSETDAQETNGKVLVTPVEEIEYEEQDLKQLATPKKQSLNNPQRADSQQMIIPIGHFEQPEKISVAPLQRRSFAPTSQ